MSYLEEYRMMLDINRNSENSLYLLDSDNDVYTFNTTATGPVAVKVSKTKRRKYLKDREECMKNHPSNFKVNNEQH